MLSLAEEAKSIFLEAAEITSEEDLRSFLEAKCGDNQPLRREVVSLLEHHDQLGDFLESLGGHDLLLQVDHQDPISHPVRQDQVATVVDFHAVEEHFRIQEVEGIPGGRL